MVAQASIEFMSAVQLLGRCAGTTQQYMLDIADHDARVYTVEKGRMLWPRHHCEECSWKKSLSTADGTNAQSIQVLKSSSKKEHGFGVLSEFSN